jgi:hypothetical protein
MNVMNALIRTSSVENAIKTLRSAFPGMDQPPWGLGLPHPGQNATVWGICLWHAGQRTWAMIASSHSRHALNSHFGSNLPQALNKMECHVPKRTQFSMS